MTEWETAVAAALNTVAGGAIGLGVPGYVAALGGTEAGRLLPVVAPVLGTVPAEFAGSTVVTAALIRETPASGETAATDGSKTKVPLAPTVRLDPAGKAFEFVTISVPAETVVPPEYVLLPDCPREC